MKNKISIYILLLAVINFLPNLLFAEKIKIKRNITYISGSTNEKHTLDIYYPKNTKVPREVVFFIHGGSWDSGKKDTYWFLGRNFARKGKILVSINYRFGGTTSYQEMAEDCNAALRYISENCGEYGGNPSRIFTMGHSAGAHLAALITMNPEFSSQINPKVKGMILNDGFGLDLVSYFKLTPQEIAARYVPPFGTNPETWKKASPFTYISKSKTPILIFKGSKTYPAILRDTDLFLKGFENESEKPKFILIKGKKHVGMISQMVWRRNKMYTYMIDFMKSQK